ncbi:unnamed protein product [Bemisia tabaci]|uniref:Uncharacterized protein n=1 Tax=Bemisia tabaci TaxID=7038 RepID=A0A9P0EXN3_BEMTA|nr:unnamed protein product [Bemisia tabaci]
MASKKDDSFAFGNLARRVISLTNEVVALIRLSFIPMNQNAPPLLANNNESHSSLAIISNNTDHKAYAIRAHSSPILLWLAERYPNVNTIHFFSDGPTSQYRNRYNIFLGYNVVEQIFRNLKLAGISLQVGLKGPQDGVGAVIKRNA